MQPPTAILRMRSRRRVLSQLNLLRRAGHVLALLISLTAAFSSLAAGFVYLLILRDLPAAETLPALLNPNHGTLLQPTMLYDRSGSHSILKLENPAIEQRQFLSLDSSQPDFLPAPLISATIASADPGFWSHLGYQTELTTRNEHPTLAQKLVHDLLLWNEPDNIFRPVRERILAAQITHQYGREQVLAWYLNSANYGRLAIGASSATQVYFGKPTSKLTIAEAAILAAAARSPALNPLDAPVAARQQSSEIIQEMRSQGLISAAQAQAALQELPEFRSQTTLENNIAPAFSNLVLEQVSQIISRSRLERGGFRILTSLDYDWQVQADCSASIHLQRMQSITAGLSIVDLEACPAARLLPTQTGREQQPAELAASLVVLEPGTGQILALVGEIGPGLDPAHLPGRPAGTLLSPFVVLTSFTRGLSPASLVWDIPTPGENDFDPGDYRGPLRLRMALVNDALGALVGVLEQVGGENAWRAAKAFGFETSQLPGGQDLHAMLADGDFTLLEITQAYAVLANQGILAGQIIAKEQETPAPAAVLSVTGLDGTSWFEAGTPVLKPVISQQLAYLITHVLSDEAARWPSLGHPNPLEIGRPAAAKLGTTLDGLDAWAVGYTPQLSIGVWIGNRGLDTHGPVQARQAAALWHALAQYTHQNLPASNWNPPPGISSVVVCDPSGLLPTPECPTSVTEIFLAGNEPTQLDNLYRRRQINRETGMLATVFTPPDQIEDRVFLIPAPEAKAWALQAEIPIPPETYDFIVDPRSSSKQINISSPAMFAYVRGKVSIRGSAAIPGLINYRLQAGKGLNPQGWVQVGNSASQPMENGLLGTWDTSELSGLYALQLVVVSENQQVDSAVIQVTVDNRAPLVNILYPGDQAENIQPGRLILHAEASDDLALKHVAFIIDGVQVDIVEQAPYVLAWQATKGKHTLLVQAIDQAGNSSQSQGVFEVK